MLAFLDSLPILVQLVKLGLYFACAVFTSLAIYQRVRHNRVSLFVALPALITLLPVSCLLVASLVTDDIEYDPWISSSEKLVGVYQGNGQTLTLRADGTYSATGFTELKSGIWSNYDWYLHLSNCQLIEPRVITRNGILCIAPYYRDEDGPPGPLLEKQSDP